MCLFSFPDVIWVILCVDEGGLLGLTQQLSSLGREMNTHQISNPSSPSANPFQLSTTPIGTSPQPIYSVPHNSPANGASDVVHVSPARRSLFNSMVSLSRDYPPSLLYQQVARAGFLQVMENLESRGI